MSRESLELQATELGITFTAESTDKELELSIQLAQANGILEQQAQAISALEKRDSIHPEVVVDGVTYQILGKQFMHSNSSIGKKADAQGRFLQKANEKPAVITSQDIISNPKLAKSLVEKGVGFLIPKS